MKNPQANSIIERSHIVITNQLRIFNFENEPAPIQNLYSVANDLLQAAAWGIRSTIHTTLQQTPGQIVFQRDMIVQLEVTTDWDMIRRRKRHLTKNANDRENMKRLGHDYEPNDKVLIKLDKLKAGGKLGRPTEGPYKVVQVHSNSTLTIERGHYRERINVRRLQPYFERERPFRGRMQHPTFGL